MTGQNGPSCGRAGSQVHVAVAAAGDVAMIRMSVVLTDADELSTGRAPTRGRLHRHT